MFLILGCSTGQVQLAGSPCKGARAASPTTGGGCNSEVRIGARPTAGVLVLPAMGDRLDAHATAPPLWHAAPENKGKRVGVQSPQATVVRACRGPDKVKRGGHPQDKKALLTAGERVIIVQCRTMGVCACAGGAGVPMPRMAEVCATHCCSAGRGPGTFQGSRRAARSPDQSGKRNGVLGRALTRTACSWERHGSPAGRVALLGHSMWALTSCWLHAQSTSTRKERGGGGRGRGSPGGLALHQHLAELSSRGRRGGSAGMLLCRGAWWPVQPSPAACWEGHDRF